MDDFGSLNHTHINSSILNCRLKISQNEACFVYLTISQKYDAHQDKMYFSLAYWHYRHYVIFHKVVDKQDHTKSLQERHSRNGLSNFYLHKTWNPFFINTIAISSYIFLSVEICVSKKQSKFLDQRNLTKHIMVDFQQKAFINFYVEEWTLNSVMSCIDIAKQSQKIHWFSL